MKIALGLMFKNEAEMLKRNLKIVSSCFEGAIILDDLSTDESQLVLSQECMCPFELLYPTISQYSFAEKRNWIISTAEKLGYDAIFFLDADETMFKTDIEKVKELLNKYEAIALSRHEFGPDDKHYNPTLYPDYQARVFLLNKGYKYRGNLHEGLYKKDNELSVFEEPNFKLSEDTSIFHYGRCKSKETIWLRYCNYGLIKQGLAKIDTIPQGMKIDLGDIFKDVIEFKGEQP
jgi:hypothetical protein